MCLFSTYKLDVFCQSIYPWIKNSHHRFSWRETFTPLVATSADFVPSSYIEGEKRIHPMFAD
jgi:hypothetical protein